MKDATSNFTSAAQSSWIEQECAQFANAWRSGESVRIEDVLSRGGPGQRSSLLRKLLMIEIEQRRRRGDDVRRDEYMQRFPEAADLLLDLWPSVTVDDDATLPTTDRGTVPNTTTTAARYCDLQFFKRGGLGALYRATDEELHREAVVKFINEKCAHDAELLAQFRVEAEITSRLDHPGVVPVYGLGQSWQGRPFYVMRLIHGRELREAIVDYHNAGGPANRGRENRQHLFTLLEQLTIACDTVAYAHDVGIVHCDIKPANIMIGKYGETYVLDWGLATTFERTTTFFLPNEPTMRPSTGPSGSQSGHRGGTYGYISPEQLTSAEPIAPTCDVYSLGATLYEVLVGQPPFNGRDPDVADKIKTGRFRRPREGQRKISRRLEAICLKAMSLSPKDRYPTAKHLATDLRNWMRDEEVQAAPDRIVDRAARLARRHRSLTSAMMLGSIFLTVAGVWAYLTMTRASHEEEMRRLSEANFATALDTFEDLCQPLANGEMTNLGMFRPFADKINDFTVEYLDKFEKKPSMQFHTSRMYELRAAVSRITTSDTTAALDDYQRAEKIYLRLLEIDEGAFELDLRLALNHLSQGRLFIQRNELHKADRVLADSAQRLAALHKQLPDDNHLKRLLAEAYHGRGEVYLDGVGDESRMESLEKSHHFFEDSRLLRVDLVSRTRGSEHRSHTRDLARSLGYLGDLYLAEGKVPQAIDSYEESKKHREELFRHNRLDPENRFQQARGLANFGYLHRGYGGDLPRAISMLTDARQVQEELVEDFEKSNEFKLDLGSTCNLLAEVHLFASLEDAADSEEHLRLAQEAAERASEILSPFYDRKHSRDRLADRQPMHGLATNMVMQSILSRASKPTESTRLADGAVDLIFDCLGSEPTLTSDELVTLALARSLQGEPQKALTRLEEATARGQNTAHRFERHRHLGFAAIAADPKLAPNMEKLLKEVADSIVPAEETQDK